MALGGRTSPRKGGGVGGGGEVTDMYMHCRHIKTNGLRCQSPALRGSQFCYYHSKVHTIGAEPNLRFGPLQLPPPEDAAAIQLSVARINDAIINGRIDLKKATALFYGIQIASQFIDRKKRFYESDTVQSAEQTADGDELAPGNYICNHEDCNKCPFSTVGQCTRWRYVNKKNEDADAGGDEDDDDEAGDDADDDSDDGEENDVEAGSESENDEDGDAVIVRPASSFPPPVPPHSATNIDTPESPAEPESGPATCTAACT